jgi:hypothetical protein
LGGGKDASIGAKRDDCDRRCVEGEMERLRFRAKSSQLCMETKSLLHVRRAKLNEIKLLRAKWPLDLGRHADKPRAEYGPVAPDIMQVA